MTRRAFIAGISGFIGRPLASALRQSGYQVSGLCRSRVDIKGCRVIAGDVVHPSSYAAEAARAHLIVHLAAPTTQAEISGDPVGFMKVTLRGTMNLLDLFRSGEGQHFVYLSSGKVYGAGSGLPYSEAAPACPTTTLGAAKKAAEDLVSFYCRHAGEKRATVLRLFNAYGPGQKGAFLVPTIIKQMGGPAVTLGNTESRRDFIYIDDVVAGICAVVGNLRNPHGEPDSAYRIFNLGSGASASPGDIVECLSVIAGRDVAIAVDRKLVRTGEPDEERADIGKLSALGWKPAVGLPEGLERTWRAASGEPA